MDKKEIIDNPEKSKGNIVVEKIGPEKFRVMAEKVVIRRGESLNIEAVVEKLPLTNIGNGEHIHGSYVDFESPEFDEIRREARKLGELPEMERPRKLVELIRGRVRYAYKSTLEELQPLDPGKVDWAINKLRTKEAKLSEILTMGLSECDQFAMLLLLLGNEAGLEGTIASYKSEIDNRNNIINVNRIDNGEPLFKSFGVGSPLIGGHAWVEFKMKNGDWMPVDPTTNLVGDCVADLETMRRANYSSSIYLTEWMTGDALRLDRSGYRFFPGESEHRGIVRLRPSLVERDGEDVELDFEGPLSITIESEADKLRDDLPARLTSLRILGHS